MYDPTLSPSFNDAAQQESERRGYDVIEHCDRADDFWADVIRTAAPVLESDLRDEVSDDVGGANCLTWLLVYMERHEARFGSHLNW